MFDPEIAQRFKDKSIRRCDLDTLVAMYQSEEDTSDKAKLLVDVILAMHLVGRNEEYGFDLEWIRAHFEPPCGAVKLEGSKVELMFQIHDDGIFFIDLVDGMYDGCSSLCGCEDRKAFLEGYPPCTSWDDVARLVQSDPE